MVEAFPVVLANVPWGIITGIASVGIGLTAIQTIGMSLIMFAGAAQLAMIELMGKQAPIAIVVVTGLIVNVRYMLYSASIARHFQHLSRRAKVSLPYFLVDANFALSVARYEDDETLDRKWYYLGASVPVWIGWQTGTIVGILIESNVLADVPLDFAIPLLFLAILIPQLKDAGRRTAAVIAGPLAVLTTGIPFNLGFLLAVVLGIAGGVLVDSRGA